MDYPVDRLCRRSGDAADLHAWIAGSDWMEAHLEDLRTQYSQVGFSQFTLIRYRAACDDEAAHNTLIPHQLGTQPHLQCCRHAAPTMLELVRISVTYRGRGNFHPLYER